MKKVFIDTSVLVRFLTRDDEKKYQHCKDLLSRVSAGRLKPYVSNIILLEIIFVLTRLYDFPKLKVRKAIDKILTMRNLTVQETTKSRTALKLYAAHNIKYQDCLIATQVPRGTKLATYDKDFKKIKSLNVVTPRTLLTQT